MCSNAICSKNSLRRFPNYRTYYRASFLHGEIEDTRCWLLHRRSRHRRAGDCCSGGSSSMHRAQRRPPCPPLPPTALRYPGIFCRLFRCLCSHVASFRASELEIGRPPRPDREAEAVGIVNSIVFRVASVQWQPRRTRIGRARSCRPMSLTSNILM